MNLKAFFIIFLLVLFNMPYQPVKGEPIDSLKQLIENASGAKQVELQIDLINLLRKNGKSDEAIRIAEDLLKKAERNSDHFNMARMKLLIAKSLITQIRDSEAIVYLKECSEIAEQYSYLEIYSESLKELGRVNYYLGNLDESISRLNQSLVLAEKAKNFQIVADSYEFMGKVYKRLGDIDTALVLYNNALQALGKVKGTEALENSASILNAIGNIYVNKGEYGEAAKIYNQAKLIFEKAANKTGVATSVYQLGVVYFYWSKYELSLSNYQIAIKIFEEINNEEGIASCYSGIGLIYSSMVSDEKAFDANKEYFTKAKEFHNQALQIFKKLNIKAKIANEIGNIANNEFKLLENEYLKTYGTFWEDSIVLIPHARLKERHETILSLFYESLKINIEIKDFIKTATSLNQIGKMHIYNASYDSADLKLNESLEMAIQIDYAYLKMCNYYDLGSNYYYRKEFDKAISYYEKIITLAEEIDVLEQLKYSYHKLSDIYKQKKDYNKSLEFYKKYTEIKDRQFTEESRKIITEMQTKYESEKKEQEIRLLNNEKKLQESTIKRQNMLILTFILGFMVVVVFVILLKRENNAKQRAFRELEIKNKLISKHKQEIEDSIIYASRIQQAVVPSMDLAKKILPDNFIYWKPRDIVSGDFYWFSKVGKKVIIVAADCTGHGVPGAFMSMLGVSFLTEIVGKYGEDTRANLTLNSLRSNVKKMLKQRGEKDEAKDGMDISLCVLDLENDVLQFAGAYNPLYLIRNGELIVYKADKMPIGIHIFEKESFTNHEIQLQKGDTFYIFSDGYVDQFGGEKGRKFMVKPFKELLLEIQDKSMDEQKAILDDVLTHWMKGFNQIDDILVIGFRI